MIWNLVLGAGVSLPFWTGEVKQHKHSKVFEKEIFCFYPCDFHEDRIGVALDMVYGYWSKSLQKLNALFLLDGHEPAFVRGVRGEGAGDLPRRTKHSTRRRSAHEQSKSRCIDVERA